MSGDLGGSNPTPWPAPPALGEQRLRSTTASPMQSPALAAGGGTLQAALSSPSSPSPSAAAANPIAVAAPSQSASSQQTLLRGSSSSSAAMGGGANNNNAEVTSPNNAEPRRFLGGVVGLSRDRTHHLRVRKRVPLAPNLTAELGVGTELMSGEVTRHAALTYDVSDGGEGRGKEKKEKRETKKEKKNSHEKNPTSKKQKKKKKTFFFQLNLAGKHLVSLRASPGLLQAARSFTFSLPRSCASAVVRLVAGVTGDGRPVFGFDVDEVRPPKLVAAAAVAALASGKPLSGAKSVPVFTARVPGVYDSWCGRVEVRASLQKKEQAATARRKAAASVGRTTSSSLDLLETATAPGDKLNGEIMGPLALDVRELSFVLDV